MWTTELTRLSVIQDTVIAVPGKWKEEEEDNSF